MGTRKKSTVLVYLEFIPFYLLWHFIGILPLKWAYALSAALFKLLFLVSGRHRKRAIAHLKHAGVCTDDESARRTARQFFLEFSKLLVEIVKMHREYRREKIRLVGPDETLRRVFPGHGDGEKTNAIIVTAHYGNWEVAGTAFSDASDRAMVSIMRPFGNPLIGRMILKSRANSNHALVNRDANGVRGLLKALKEKKQISILIDQHASHAEGVETVFFGQPCRTHKTPAMLHLKTKIPILPELTRRVPGGNFEFELVFGDLIEYEATGDKEADIRAITQLCTSALEKMIAERPEQWLWAHRRWLNINRDRSKRKKRRATVEKQ